MTKLTPDEQKVFQTATKAVYDKWKTRIGADLVGAAEKAVAGSPGGSCDHGPLPPPGAGAQAQPSG